MQSLTELPFVAGHVTLDFVNTAEGRGHAQAGDVLLTPDDLWTWGLRYGLLRQPPRARRGSPRDRTGSRELTRARDARELLYSIFLARRGQQAPDPDDLRALSGLVAEAHRAATLTVDESGSVGWEWDPTRLDTVRHLAVARALELLVDAPSPRLKQCPGEHCGWFFLDTTKRGNRRWCQMSECGQDAKDRRRRERRAGTPSGGGAHR